MKPIKTTLPSGSILLENHKKFDYVDSFQGEFTDNENIIQAKDAVQAFFHRHPPG